jgi:hypothetical protein
MTTHSIRSDAAFDFDGLLRANLEHVFNERDDAKRAAAIAALYTHEPVMYEPSRLVQGQADISQVASDLLQHFGPTFRFRAEGVAVGHHGMATLRWSSGEPGMPPVVQGFDTAEIIDGRIARLWVLIDPPGN